MTILRDVMGLWRRQRDREAFAKFMREWAEALEAQQPNPQLSCHSLTCATASSLPCDCYRQLDRIYGQPQAPGGDLSDREASASPEAVQEPTEAVMAPLEAKECPSRLWPDSHLRAHGLLRRK